MAMCVMAVVGAAPCQCFSPGGNQTTSPGRISSMGPPQRCARPKPAVTIRVWPRGWVCQAVRAEGSNVTLAQATRAGSGAWNRGSTRTVPVNQSAGPLFEGCDPLLLISIDCDRRNFAWLLLETSYRRTRATSCLSRGAGGGRAATAHGPAFTKRRTITDLDRHAVAVLIHLHPERIGLVESERFPGGRIKRSEDGRRFTRREDTTAHVALRTGMLPRSYEPVERLIPILHRLAIHLHNDISDNRGTDSFVGEGKMNVGRVTAIEFEDWPHRRAHLLALHVGGVTGNTQSQESNKGRDDRVISTGAARLLF